VRKLGALVAAALVAAAIAAPAQGTHVRPKGATPITASLVPFFSPCTSPNRTHGAPLAFPSCAPPVGPPDTGPGTPDANGAAVNENDPGRTVMRRADGKPIRVLVVDDEAVLAELMSMALRYEGWEIATASDGATAIALARDNPPDVVVLDVMLPDMSGLDVLRRLREQIPGLPLLLLTAKDSLEDRIAGLTAGGDDYVTKPFSLEEVVLRLRALLRRTGVTDESGGAKIDKLDTYASKAESRLKRSGSGIPSSARVIRTGCRSCSEAAPSSARAPGIPGRGWR